MDDKPMKNMLAGRLGRIVTKLKDRGLWRDQLSLVLIGLALLVNLIDLVWLGVRLHPTNFAVPIRYSSFEGFTALGPWYSIYLSAGLGVLVMLTNTVLALISFERSRMTSFLLLTGSVLVAVFSLVISSAFAAIV